MAQYDHNIAYECNLAVGSTMDMSLKGHIDSVEGDLETRKTMRHPSGVGSAYKCGTELSGTSSKDGDTIAVLTGQYKCGSLENIIYKL